MLDKVSSDYMTVSDGLDILEVVETQNKQVSDLLLLTDKLISLDEDLERKTRECHALSLVATVLAAGAFFMEVFDWCFGL